MKIWRILAWLGACMMVIAAFVMPTHHVPFWLRLFLAGVLVATYGLLRSMERDRS